MKYVVSVGALLLACVSAWAEPETMKMYATLSAPVASFWQVKTEACEPVTMPSNSQLNLGFVECKSTDNKTCNGSYDVASSGGTITLQGIKPLTVNALHMEKGTQFTIGNARWLVTDLNIGKGAEATLNGTLLAKELYLPSTQPTGGAQALTLDVTNLRVGSSITTLNGEFNNIVTVDGTFNLTGGGSGSASFSPVPCSINEPSCKSGYYVLHS